MKSRTRYSSKKYMENLTSSNKLLHNKYVLYGTLGVTCLFLLWLLLANKIGLIVIFALIAYITYCFNRNMIIVLGLSLIITYIATLGFKVKEGLENASDVAEKKEEKKEETDTSTSNNTSTNNNTSTSNDTSTDVKPSSTDEGMNNISGGKKQARIDYASTMEDAYDDLNKILGGEGISRLTNDTNKLMEQQLKLTDAMKNMGPLIDSAKALMQGFDFNNLDNIASMAKKFMPSK